MDCGTGRSNLSVETGNIFLGTKGFCIIAALGMRFQPELRDDFLDIQLAGHPTIILVLPGRTRVKSAFGLLPSNAALP